MILPAIEKRLPRKAAMTLRGLWVAAFAIILMAGWNIGPDTYMFYVREALPYTPKVILVELGCTLAVLIWFASQGHIAENLGRWHAKVLAVGALLAVVKLAGAVGPIHPDFVREGIRTPIPAVTRMLYLTFTFTPKPYTETPDRTFSAFVRQDGALPSHVVLMLVESWAEQPAALQTMAHDIGRLGFHVEGYGFTSYRGSTLSGEFRELCAKYVQPSDGLISDAKSMNCVPAFMHTRNYRVIGLHGYDKSFYARNTFWTRFGIEHQMFKEELRAEPQCPGPFPGVCDENLIRGGIDMLDASTQPTFLYMLTLSSHEPVNPAALKRHGAYFNEVPVVHPTQVVTRRAISSLLADLKGRRTQACTLVYVAGDHQPPSASAKGGIFESGKVPYLVFSQNCKAAIVQ
jgi:hypothetical protein